MPVPRDEPLTAAPVPRTPADQPPGRRERHKQATRQAIETTAFSLFAEHGYDATTVEMITEAVDISERTFFRYFASKEDLLLGEVANVLEEVLAEVHARPAHERPIVAVREAFLTVLGARMPSLARFAISRISDIGRPRFGTRLLAALQAWEEGLAAALVERAGEAAGPGHGQLQFDAAVMAAASTAALRATLVEQAPGGVSRIGDPQATLRRAFDVLDRGCTLAGEQL